MAEKKLMEKVLHQVVRTFPKVNMPMEYVPYPIPYPPLAKSRFEIFVHVAERGNGPLGHVDLCIDGYVYSYGNYDERDLKLGGWIACYFVRTIIKKHYIFIQLRLLLSKWMPFMHT